jgi:phage minor structural protein
MICIYEKTTSDFNNNGLGTLEPIECTFKPIINGVWSLEMTLPYDAEGKSQLIANDRILKVTDIDCISEQTSNNQLFRIYDYKKDDNFVSVIAYPIGLDARFDTFVDSVKMNYKTASQAIAQMNGLSSKYTVSGSGYDATVKSAEYANANLISILNGDNGFVQVWDGEICYDNYNIRVNHRLGSSSNPLDVRYGKNITGMSYDMDASNIITQLYPKSKDNYPLNINNRNYVNASNFADYPIPHMYYIQAPFNLVQLSDDGSEEYLMSADVFDHIKTLTAEWLNKALSQDEIYGGLLKEIELDWINNNYDLTMIHDGVQGIVEYLWRKLIGSSHANITHGAVQSLIYNAMKAGFDDVLKNSDSGYYIGSTSKKLMDTGFGTQFYSYEWDVAGQYRVTPDGEGYVWVYASSKWNQLNTNGETTGATDKTKWKRYKVKGKTYKRYGNKKKNRYLKSQWWKINDVWYWFDSNGKSIKGSALNSMYYEYFEDAEIMLDGEQQTIYDILTEVCSNSESQLVGLLNNQMEQYCLNLFENEKLSYPTVKLDINMVDLSQTTEYKDFQSLERIHLGDSVKVFNPRLGIESTVRVIGLTYDVLRKMNTEIQIGVTETSVINLLNNIGKGSNEVRYVAGDGITIENNTISVIPPTKPYLEDVILNGESVVRNHKAYIDLDELGIDESIDVLYGEEVPNDEDDGEDKDFYFRMGGLEAIDVISNQDYKVKSTELNPIAVVNFTKNANNEFDFTIQGKPANDGNGETIWFPLHNCIEGNEYTVTFKAKFGSGALFPYSQANNTMYICGTGINFEADTNEHTYNMTFIYNPSISAYGGSVVFQFNKSEDNTDFSFAIEDFVIQGTFFSDYDELYNKTDGIWRRYLPKVMVGATDNEDGYKGLVATPKPSDKNKFWRGDGTWAEAGGGGGSDLPLSVVNGKLCITYEDS